MSSGELVISFWHDIWIRESSLRDQFFQIYVMAGTKKSQFFSLSKISRLGEG